MLGPKRMCETSLSRYQVWCTLQTQASHALSVCKLSSYQHAMMMMQLPYTMLAAKRMVYVRTVDPQYFQV